MAVAVAKKDLISSCQLIGYILGFHQHTQTLNLPCTQYFSLKKVVIVKDFSSQTQKLEPSHTSLTARQESIAQTGFRNSTDQQNMTQSLIIFNHLTSLEA